MPFSLRRDSAHLWPKHRPFLPLSAVCGVVFLANHEETAISKGVPSGLVCLGGKFTACIQFCRLAQDMVVLVPSLLGYCCSFFQARPIREALGGFGLVCREMPLF